MLSSLARSNRLSSLAQKFGLDGSVKFEFDDSEYVRQVPHEVNLDVCVSRRLAELNGSEYVCQVPRLVVVAVVVVVAASAVFAVDVGFRSRS